MEDPRLSRMYARNLAREFSRWRRRTGERIRARRRFISVLLSLLLVAGFAAGYVAHIHGRFSKLKRELKEARNPVTPTVPMPGGQEPYVLRRALLVGGSAPEFLSATLLPGRGMDVLQITAFIPGRGEVPILASPSLEDATRLLNSNDPQARQTGGVFEAPWAGRAFGVHPPDSNRIMADWHGHALSLPWTGTFAGADVSEGGLLLDLPSETISNTTLPDGGVVQGVVAAGNFGGRWPSKSQTTVEVQLSSRALDLRVTMLNNGQEAEPVGIGWNPHLLIPSGDRSQARLRLPLGRLEERRGGRATGRLLPVEGTDADFTARGGRALGSLSLSETLVQLRPGFLDSGPIMELRDTASGVGLRLTAMTPLIRAIGVEALAGSKVVTLRPQMNYDDPFSRVWSHEEDTGMVVLAPGQSVQWKIRLEVFALSKGELAL